MTPSVRVEQRAVVAVGALDRRRCAAKSWAARKRSISSSGLMPASMRRNTFSAKRVVEHDRAVGLLDANRPRAGSRAGGRSPCLRWKRTVLAPRSIDALLAISAPSRARLQRVEQRVAERPRRRARRSRPRRARDAARGSRSGGTGRARACRRSGAPRDQQHAAAGPASSTTASSTLNSPNSRDFGAEPALGDHPLGELVGGDRAAGPRGSSRRPSSERPIVRSCRVARCSRNQKKPRGCSVSR